MSFLILVRHGQSIWNLEGRFTGWVDVDLTKQGKLEAEKAGILIKDKNIEINHLYSSLQLRANNTLKIIQGVLDNQDNFIKAWQLNERHYGALTGLNKVEMSKKIGEEKVLEFRRSWDVKPEPLNKESPYHPMNIQTYKQLSKEIIPDTESLKDTYERVLKYFKDEIKKNLIKDNVLVSAHGNSIRALCKYLLKLDNNQISSLEIPTGNPLIIELNENCETQHCEYLDKERAKNLIVF
jgi:2,3-bisphosphoglycerate-dependent phosphoglycerate mutase